MIVIFNTTEKNTYGECKYCLKIKDEVVFTFWHNPANGLPFLLLRALETYQKTNNKKHIKSLTKDEGHRADLQVSFAEPNQQLFTIAEVGKLLLQQKQICSDAVFKWLELKTPEGTYEETIENAPLPYSWDGTLYNKPPMKIPDEIIVKS